MKKTVEIEVPDLEIPLSHGDKAKIFIRDDHLFFDVACDGDGVVFSITKDKMREMIK